MNSVFVAEALFTPHKLLCASAFPRGKEEDPDLGIFGSRLAAAIFPFGHWFFERAWSSIFALPTQVLILR
jgi:hypothetical protein